MSKEENIMENNNKSNNNLLIIVIVVLVMIVMALTGYIILNKDNKENDKKPETKQEEKEQKIKDIDVLNNISTKIDLLVGNEKNSVEYEASKTYAEFGSRFGLLKNELTSKDKQQIVMESFNFEDWENLTGDAWKNNQEMSDHVNNDLKHMPEERVFKDNKQITAEKVNQKSVELFGKEITNPVSIIEALERCSKYIYDAKSKLYFRPAPRCGGSSDGRIQSYKSKFTKKGNVAYAYVSFAYVMASSEGYKVYKDYDYQDEKINYKNEYQTSRLASPDYFKLDSTNYQDFSEYKFTFKKGDNDNYYFVDVEQVK